MDNLKPGRRRTHEPELDDNNHTKRKRKRDVEPDTSDSVQIVGETHTNNTELKQLDGYLRGTREIESGRRMLPNGACKAAEIHGHHNQRGLTTNGVRGKERVLNGVNRGDTHSSSTPNLPPALRESERMVFVQHWINTIPPDLPLWVQTSLTKIVSITNPEYYPEEDEHHSNSNGAACEGGSESPNGTHQQPGTGKEDRNSPQIPGYASFPVSNYPRPPTGHLSLARVTNARSGGDRNRSAPVGRLFDDDETELVVKLFRDYFTKGSCPILSEVRRRTANTSLDGRRTATSIRAKIKRLQTSGRWTNYTGL